MEEDKYNTLLEEHKELRLTKVYHISVEDTYHGDQERIDVNLKVMKTVEIVQTVVLNVKRSATILEIKNKLQHEKGVDAKLQELFLQGTFLCNDRSLSNYMIVGGSSVNVHVSAGQEIEIFVEMPMGKIIPLNVKEGDTVRRIKEMVHDTRLIPPEQQTLVHMGTPLKDTHTLSACNIGERSTVHLVVEESQRMEILISFQNGEVESYTAGARYTVWDLKTVIKSRTRVTQGRQRLTYDGKQLEDWLTLAECDLGFRPILKLRYAPRMQKMQILIKWWKSDVPLCVHSCDCVYVLRKKIEEEIGIPCYMDDLTFGGRTMKDSRTLGDYNICEGSIINVVVRFS